MGGCWGIFFAFVFFFVALLVVMLLILSTCLFLRSVEFCEGSWQIPVVCGEVLASLIWIQSVQSGGLVQTTYLRCWHGSDTSELRDELVFLGDFVHFRYWMNLGRREE
jgi:hypothetical protein